MRQLFLHGLMTLDKKHTLLMLQIHTGYTLFLYVASLPFLDFWIRDAWNPLPITDRGSFPTSQLLRPTFPDTRNSPSWLRMV